MRIYLDASFQGVKRLLVLAFDNTDNGYKKSHRIYFLPRVIVTDYNVLFDIRNFYDQPIKNQIKKYNKFRKIVTGQGDHHTTVCLFHYVT